MADEGSDEIFVDVVARLDEASADEAAEKLSEKFKNAAKDVGDNLKDFGKNIGDSIKDAHLGQSIKDALGSDTVRDIGRGVGRTIAEELGASIKDSAGGIGGYLGQSLRDAIGGDTIDTITGTVGTVVDKVQTLKEGLHALHSGDVTGGLKDLSEAFRGIAPDDFLNNTKGFLDKFQESQKSIRDTATSAKELAELFGGGGLLAGSRFAAPLAELVEGSSPFLLPTAATLFAGKQYMDWLGKQPNYMPAPGVLPNQPFMPAGPPAPRPGIFEGPSAALRPGPLPGTQPRPGLLGPNSLPTVLGEPTLPGVDIPMPGLEPSNSYRDPHSQDLHNTLTTGGRGGSASVQAQQAVVEAGSATVMASSLSLGGLTLPQAVAGAPRANDATSNWWTSGRGGGPSALGQTHGEPSISGIPMPGMKSHDKGGILPGDSPGYDNMIGILSGGQAVGLEGGEGVLNPRVMGQPGMAALVGALNKGYDGGTLGDLVGGDKGANQSNPITSILGGSPQKLPGAGAKPPGPGDIHGQSPGGVMPGQAPDQPSPPQTTIPQGQGKGFGISGGALGAAEGAAESGADLFAPGSGAAMQIGMQEANRAIAFGVQAATTAAVEAPLDTFWLSDSGLSDPSHSWFGKLGLSMIGKHGSVENMAGLTQAPLAPGQGQGGQQGSPLGGQQGGGNGPTINIEHQHNGSDVDHENNNKSLVNQMGAYAY